MKYLSALIIFASVCVQAQTWTLTKDLVLDNGTYPLWNNVHIRHTTNYNAALVRDLNGFNDSALLVWNNDASQTNVFRLDNQITTNIGGPVDFDISDTNLVVAGNSGSSLSNSAVYVFGLNSRTLPSAATTLALYHITNNTASDVTVTAFTNGAFAIVLPQGFNGTSTNLIMTAYISSLGTFTNNGYSSLVVTDSLFITSATYMTATEQPGSSNFWVFVNRDSSHSVYAGQFKTKVGATDGLFFTNTWQVASDNPVFGLKQPYGETFGLRAVYDRTTNRVLLAYPNNNVSGSTACGTPGYVSDLVLLGVDEANQNGYFVTISSNKARALGLSYQIGISQLGGRKVFAYWTPPPANTCISTPVPMYLQTFSSDTGPNVFQQVYTINGGGGSFAFDETKVQYIVKDPSGVNHLLMFSPGIFFVDPITGNDSNPGTSITIPWAHLPGSLNGTVTNVLSDGMSVIVKGGSTNYSRVEVGSNYVGNAAYSSILIQSGDLFSPAWGSGRAIIDGGTTNTAGFALGGGLSSGILSGITIDGFEVRNIAAGAAGNGYDNSSGSSCILAGGSVHPANWLTIKRCYLHDAARSIDNTGHGIEFAGFGTNFIVIQNVIGPNIGTKGIEPYRESFGVISNNYISGTGDHCISFNGTTNVDCGFNVINNNPPYVHEPQYGISVADGRNLDVYDNLVYRSVFPVTNTIAGRSGMGIGVYGISISNRFALNTIAFFNDPANSGAAQSAISEKAASTNSWTEYYNNLVFSNYNAAGPFGFTADTVSSLSNRMSYCDIFANNSTEQVMATETANVDTGFTVAAYNPTFGIFTNNQQLSPSFQAGSLPSGLDANYHPNSGYFVLTHSTPTVIWNTGNTNTGDAVHGYDHSAGKFGRDIAGIQRTVWSMGAYELDRGNVIPFTNVSTFISGKVFIGQGKVFIK